MNTKRYLSIQPLFQRPLLLMLLLCACLALKAQEITFNASVNRNPVAAGERFTLTFTLTNAQAKVAPPDLSGFMVVFGPSTSASYSNVNGRASMSQTVSYVLMAEKEGRYTIGKAKAYTDKGVLETDPISVTVEKSPHGSASSGHGAQPPTSSQQQGDIFTSIVVNKSKAYIGEPVTATYYLYSRYMSLELGKMDFPNLPGFWSEDLKIENATWENQLVTVNGLRYRVAVLKRQVLYPQKSGKLAIKPFKVECIVSRSFFNPGSRINAASNASAVEVLPFPSGAPAEFKDIAGNYRVEASLSAKSVKANEAVTFKFKVTGEGNLKMLNAPEIEFPGDFEIYDPKINDKIRLSGSGLSGSREFEYLIIPRLPGEYIIPSVTFSYFDLSSRSYKTFTTGELKLSVDKGAASQAGTYIPGSQQRVAILKKDIRYITTDPMRIGATGPFRPDKPLFWLLFSLVPFSLAGLWLYKQRQDNLRRDAVKYKALSANKVATKRLADAKKSLISKDRNRFYDATCKALYGYIGDKTGIPAGDLSRKVIESRLVEFNVPPAVINDFLNTLELSEMGRFAPIANSSMEQVYGQAAAQIEKLEKVLK